MTSLPASVLRALRVAVGGCHGPDRGDRRAAARLPARALGRADRAGAPAPHQLAELHRDLLADEHVELIALLDDRRAARWDRAVAAHDHVQQRLARQPELAHRAALDRVAVRAPGTASSPRRAG